MARVISGTKALKQSRTLTGVVSQGAIPLNAIRCPKCQGIASPTTSRQNKPVHLCAGCGASFTSVAM